jgi:hypothetical protein
MGIDYGADAVVPPLLDNGDLLAALPASVAAILSVPVVGEAGERPTSARRCVYTQ